MTQQEYEAIRRIILINKPDYIFLNNNKYFELILYFQDHYNGFDQDIHNINVKRTFLGSKLEQFLNVSDTFSKQVELEKEGKSFIVWG
jgi:hypothetical protein